MNIRSIINNASCFVLVLILSFIFLTNTASAETKIFIKEYTYQASEVDSKVSCRAIALEQVKRLLLEELGTYLESHTEVSNFQLTKDQITSLTAGIVQTEIVGEKWDGEKFWLKAKIAADPDGVTKAIDDLRKDRQKTRDLERVRAAADEYLRENEQLRKELLSTKANIEQLKKYNENIDKLSATDWFEKGSSFGVTNTEGAIEAFTKAIELNPKMAEAYIFRGFSYVGLLKFREGLNDSNKAIELMEKLPLKEGIFFAYAIRAFGYAGIGNYKQAIDDSNRAIRLCPYSDGPLLSFAYLSRGFSYDMSGKYQNAITDFDKALSSDPESAMAAVVYQYRGHAYFTMGKFSQAIDDYNAHIKLSPWKLRDVYRNLALAHAKLGNSDKFFENLKIAASLGDIESQEALRKVKMEW
jgi:tetratricopeptide (TPR) repeat protein